MGKTREKYTGPEIESVRAADHEDHCAYCPHWTYTNLRIRWIGGGEIPCCYHCLPEEKKAEAMAAILLDWCR